MWTYIYIEHTLYTLIIIHSIFACIRLTVWFHTHTIKSYTQRLFVSYPFCITYKTYWNNCLNENSFFDSKSVVFCIWYDAHTSQHHALYWITVSNTSKATKKRNIFHRQHSFGLFVSICKNQTKINKWIFKFLFCYNIIRFECYISKKRKWNINTSENIKQNYSRNENKLTKY